MAYREKKEDTEKYRRQYVDGIEKLINRLEKKCEEQRRHYIKDIMANRERYRREFLKLLGWPLTENGKLPEILAEKLCDEREYSIYRVQVMIFDEYILTGLLFKYNDNVRRPFVIAQHGKLGTPELISGFYGRTANYNEMVSRILAGGANVFAPQLLLWSEEEYGTAYNRQEIDARLKRSGSSIVTLEIYSIMQVINYYEKQEWVGNIGIAGMSYGGGYALLTAAADTRIKAVITCSFFSDGNEFIQTDLCRENERKYFGQAEIACLIYPRKLFIEMGDADALFDWQRSYEEYKRIKQICGNEEQDWIEFTVFDGEHEFYREDIHIKKFLDCLKKEEML